MQKKNAKKKKKKNVSKNMPPCHFLLMVIAIESSLKIEKEQKISNN